MFSGNVNSVAFHPEPETLVPFELVVYDVSVFFLNVERQLFTVSYAFDFDIDIAGDDFMVAGKESHGGREFPDQFVFEFSGGINAVHSGYPNTIWFVCCEKAHGVVWNIRVFVSCHLRAALKCEDDDQKKKGIIEFYCVHVIP